MYHNNSFLLDGFSTADQLGLFNVYINFITFTSGIQQAIYSTPNKGTCTTGGTSAIARWYTEGCWSRSANLKNRNDDLIIFL